MNQGRYIFSQLCDFLPVDFFKWLVKKYEGNKYVKSFTCWNHLLVLLFGQLSNREGAWIETTGRHYRPRDRLCLGGRVD